LVLFALSHAIIFQPKGFYKNCIYSGGEDI
jgi:hypothetical protein